MKLTAKECTRTNYHDGPCNGYARAACVRPSGARTPRPPSDNRPTLMRKLRAMVADHSGTPTIHENGFIQLPLDDARTIRLHVWPDGVLQRQATVNTVHDHRFDFRSFILTGQLVHIEYDWTPRPAGPYQTWLANTCGSLEPAEYGDLTHRGAYVFAPGSNYTFTRHRFHDSYGVGLTATLMFKTGNDPAHTPRIVCQRDAPPDNTYERTPRDLNLVWDYIQRAMRAAGY